MPHKDPGIDPFLWRLIVEYSGNYIDHILDHYLRHINKGFAIGFTSVLIIVGSIIDLRRSYQAYNVMPSLSKALRQYGV
ncbi:preprotein translocase subunit SCY2, chloroplastic-like [Euphorbia lathyris]|uniref:preprotein translocase subunit SCY2, chloroplastic-like n=1 Tax=Euphorbia lathyris TaxID=212925 RepID=UPI0033138C7A